jgi:Reverse transcriptase (RNA-dependent DNA polymerase)
VVRPITIRLVLSIAITNKWPIEQLDVQNAFLHGDLKETVHMHQPPSFINPAAPHHVWHLSKALYGLKQSPRAWFQTLHIFLLSLGFAASHHDPSLFVLHSNLQTIILLVYVDDIIITSTTSSLISSILHQLKNWFAIKDLGSLHYFLGIEVSFNNNSLHLSQPKYIIDLLRRANMH